MDGLNQEWWHSFEEDHDHVRVYRPDGYDFPAARGRRGIELHDDGSVTEFALGRGDAPEAHEATWSADADLEKLHIHDGSGAIRTMRLVHLSPERLELDVGEST